MSATFQPRIAIVGGGPGGLILLRTLRSRGISATLYEREDSMTSRAHLGGSLDLGWQSGQRAFHENGLEEEFNKHSRLEGQELKICDAAGKVLLSGEGGNPDDPLNSRPEIDRSDIRKILVNSVPADSIKWGYGLSSVRALGDGQHELTFSNGSTVVVDIVVGADGAHSRVRPLLSSVAPVYSGIMGAELGITPAASIRPEAKEVNELVGHGSMFAAQGGKMLAGQRNSDGRIRTYASIRAPEDWTLPTNTETARKALLDIFKDWAPVMRKFIELTDNDTIYLRPMYYLPVGHRWDHVHGVTLIGDAAHLITPFAGAGANLAMLDGLELGLLLADAISGGKGVDEREAAVREWEEKMFAAAAKMVAIAVKNGEAWFGPDAPQAVVDTIKTFLANPEVRRQA